MPKDSFFALAFWKEILALKKIIAALSLVLFALTGCSSSIEETEKVVEKRDIDLVAMGDSLTVGIGDEENKNGYAGRFVEAMPEEMNGVKQVVLLETAKKGRRSDELITQIKSGDIDNELKTAELITLTIGGNDLMKVFRTNITNLQKSSFDTERPLFEQRYKEVFQLIRERNATAPIIAMGVYNPLTVYTTDPSQFEDILDEWNTDMKATIDEDPHAVFVPVVDLFISNEEEVYSEDYFHPNAKGYTNMTTRIFETLDKTDVYKLSDGKLEMKDGKEDE